MSATERMITYHLSRLKDKNPEVRIKSIQELVLLKAVNAFDTLEEIYRTDTDPAVRKAAQDAGKQLFQIKKTLENETPESGSK